MASYFDVIPKDIVNYMEQNYLHEFDIMEIRHESNILIIASHHFRTEKKALIQEICTHFEDINLMQVRNPLILAAEVRNCVLIVDDVHPSVQVWRKLTPLIWNHRSRHLSVVVSIQGRNWLPQPSVQVNFDYVFIFKPKHAKDEQKLRECFPGAEFHDNTITVLRQRYGYPEQWFFFNQE